MTASPPSPNLGKNTATNKGYTTTARLSALIPTLTTELSPVTVCQPAISASGPLLSIQGNQAATAAIPSTGVWVAPDLNNGANYTVQVEVFGAGGGGGGGDSTTGGGGGGGGEYALEQQFTVTPGQSYVWIVAPTPVGGSASANASLGGQNGSLTIFDVAAVSPTSTTGVVANGGQAGDESAPGSGGAGGTGSTNTIHFDGGAGADNSGDVGSDNPLNLIAVDGPTYWTPSGPSPEAIRFFYIFNDDHGRVEINDASGNDYSATVTRIQEVNLGLTTPTAPQQSCAFGDSQQIFNTPLPGNPSTCVQFESPSLTEAAGKITGGNAAFGGTDFTISGWIQPDASGTWGNTAQNSYAVIVANTQDYSGNNMSGVALYLVQEDSKDNPSWVLAGAVGNGTSRTLCTTPLTPTPGTWYYVVMTWVSGTLKLYVNSVLESTATNTYTNVPNGAYNLTFGLDPGTTANWYFGSMSNFWFGYGAAAGTATLDVAYGVSPPTGGAGGGASGDAGGAGGAGAAGAGAGGGNGGTAANVTGALSGTTTPGTDGVAGATGGETNVSPANPPGGGGGGSGNTTGSPPDVMTITVPFTTAATYCGVDAGAASGNVFSAPLEGTNTQLFYGGASSDSASGSKNSMLLLPPGLLKTLNPQAPNGPAYQILSVSLTMTNAMVSQTVTNICEMSYSEDTTLPANYVADDFTGVLGDIPFRVQDTTVTYDLTWNTDFVEALQGMEGVTTGAIILGPGNTPSFDAYNATTGASYYGAVYGPGSFDSDGNSLAPYLTIVYVESESFPNQGTPGGYGQITVAQVDNTAVPVFAIEPYAITAVPTPPVTGAPSQVFAQGATGPITTWDATQTDGLVFVPETWHTMAGFSTGYAHDSPAPSYRIYPDSTVGLAGVVSVAANTSSNIVCSAFDSFDSGNYYPLSQKKFLCAASANSTSSDYVELTISTSGELQCTGGAAGSTTAFTFNLDGVRFPLDY